MESNQRPAVVLHRLKGSKKAHEVCALVEALHADGQRIAVWVSDPGRAAILDQYLWTYSQSSFVPHVLWDGVGEPDDPVVIVAGRFEHPPGTSTLVVVDRLPDPAAAASFVAIHDLDAGGAEDEGKAQAWTAAGFEVTTRGGPIAPAGPRRRR
jgi:DNA polymerase IIIc chi subunit